MFYRSVKWILFLLLKIYNRIVVHSIKNIPKEGSFIIVANHVSLLDPVYIGLVLPRKLHFMAKKESFNSSKILSWILTHLGAFPVDRSKPDITAMRTAIGLLKEGKVLALFPQGGRSDDVELTELKKGAAYFAEKTNTPILPIYVKGTDKVMPKDQLMIKPKKVEIFIGETIEVPNISESYKGERVDVMTNQLKVAINHLAQQNYNEQSTKVINNSDSINHKS